MQQLSALDASFLYMETASQTGHVASLALYDPSSGPEGSMYERVRRTLLERIPALTPMRRRLVDVPLGLDHPYWVEDPNFDIDFHLRHIAVPPPGDEHQLAELVARLHSRPLDRTMPLWELYVIEGLQSGLVAVYTKLHHCTIDGVAGVELTAALLDTEPSPAGKRPTSPRRDLDPLPTQFEMLARGAFGLAFTPGRTLQFGLRLARGLARARELGPWVNATGVVPIANMLGLNRLPVVRDLLARVQTDVEDASPIPQTPAPQTPFNRPITPRRSLAFVTLPLDGVKVVKRAFDTTVNDVVLAVCAHALRRYLERRGELPDSPLVAMVPVSVRSEAEKKTFSNRVTTVLTELATDEPDPAQRLLRIQTAMKSAKRMREAMPADLLQDFTQFQSTLIAGRAARVIARTWIADRLNPPFNVTISNVPGPRDPLYLRGARLEAMYPVSIVLDGQGLNMTVISYRDRLDFGLTACREVVPDLWEITEGLKEGLAALVHKAETAAPPAALVRAATARRARRGRKTRREA